MNEPTEQSQCPICQRLVRTRRMQKLYGMPVCRKCRNNFANRRQLAYIVDSALFWILLYVLATSVYFVFPGLAEALDQDNAAVFIANLLLSWVLLPLGFALKDGFNGQSPGKWLCGVRVADKDTLEPTGFKQSLKRNFVLLIPLMPFVVALQLIKGLRSGDKWANTRMVLKKLAYRPPFDVRGLLCTHCGYDLTGNVTGRCPECGHDIPVTAQITSWPVPEGRFS